MNVNATSALPGRYCTVGAAVILALSLLVVGWAAHRGDNGPHSVTIIGISEPGTGTGLYNGLRAKSIPVISDLGPLEQGPPGARIYSSIEPDSFQ